MAHSKTKKLFAISDARFRAFVEKSWDVLVIVNRRSKVLYATPSMVKMFGREYREFVGIKGLRFVYPPDLPKVLKAFAEVITSPQGTVTTMEMRILHKDGYYKWIEARATNLLQDPEIKAVVIHFHDITASKELEEKKNEFISIASHELRTPLTVLKLHTKILSQELQKPSIDVSQQIVKKMESQLDQLGRLVNDLLDVSRIQENKLSLQKERFCLDDLVKDVASDLQIHIATHTIHIASRYHGVIYADAFRIKQALINLIMNAVKFSPNANKVIVTISGTKKDIRIRVKDFGMGMSKAEQHKVFERFFQSHARTNTGGLGLGLYIASNIIAQHHGQLLVSSAKGKGTMFTILLPKR